jgi:hypothetical protein
LMPRYIDWNFGSKKYPVFKPGKLSDSARKAIKEMFTTVVTASVLNSTPEFVRELEKRVSEDIGLGIDYEEIAKQEAEAAEAKQQQEEEAAKLQQEMQIEQVQQAAKEQPGSPLPPAGASGSVGLSGDMDDLYEAAQRLFLARPDDTQDTGPIDDL